MNEVDNRIEKLKDFIKLLDQWNKSGDQSIRDEINRLKNSVEREVVEANCFNTITLSPPPAVGGMIIRGANLFDMIFENYFGLTFIAQVRDMINQTIGVIEDQRANPSIVKLQRNEPEIVYEIQKGYVFVAMPIDLASHSVDALDTIKEVCSKCDLTAERIDETQTNERITDRILESIQKAEYVIVDLSASKPNVFYEAGYAQGIGKLPIYIARKGTVLEFDLKDYPVIFFENFRELKSSLEARLRALATHF